MTTRRTTAVLAGALALTWALVGCTAGGSEPTPTPSGTAGATGTDGLDVCAAALPERYARLLKRLRYYIIPCVHEASGRFSCAARRAASATCRLRPPTSCRSAAASSLRPSGN